MEIQRGYDLVERMRQLGAEDPEEWASSELEEDIAQEARWLAIRQIREAITWTPEGIRRIPEVTSLLEAGADEQLILAAVREVAREAAFTVLNVIDSTGDPDAPEDSPGWMLLEARVDPEGEPYLTGRDVGALHESLGFPAEDGVYRD
ncbi:hypothetical protein [Microbacterium sp. ABRD28]|uniref:hypothetical protein n=1 Tax=Microbacterium sp. ABRD28 TaxID=2268461 RepID=UPI000F556298|nr:hypothetical protein [Microbacterium sp. ABRD28]AZC12869.1 hypothetical protein DT073_03315 [Microbacterium sp. ABRD28]